MSSEIISATTFEIDVQKHPSIMEIADALERTVLHLSSHNNSESRLAALAQTTMGEGRRAILPENEASAERSAPIIELVRRRRNILSWTDPMVRAG
jgi:hypothetical protein